MSTTAAEVLSLPDHPDPSAETVECVRVITVIEPPRGWLRLNLQEVWRYRDLLTLLVW